MRSPSASTAERPAAAPCSSKTEDCLAGTRRVRSAGSRFSGIQSGMRTLSLLFLCLALFVLLPNVKAQSRNPQNADVDFNERCHTPGVVRCVGFDSLELVKPHLDPAWDRVYRVDVDTTTKASGGGSLRFTIPTHSGANSSGDFWLEFADDLSVQFGEGQEFYVQWRQRFSPEMLTTAYAGGNGWKQIVIGEGSRPDHKAYACTELQLVVENTYLVGAPRMYHSCGRKDGQFDTLQVYDPKVGAYVIQNAVGCPHHKVTSPPCFMYKPNQWMTFQIHVKVGTWYKNDKKYHHDSTVQLWMAEEGKPSKLVIDFSPERGTGYDLVNLDPQAKYGKVWLMTYNTNKDANQDHPEAHTWYDELIISRTRIPDPK